MNACYSLEPTYASKMAGFVEYQCSVGQGVQGYVGTSFVKLAVVVCQQEREVRTE